MRDDLFRVLSTESSEIVDQRRHQQLLQQANQQQQLQTQPNASSAKSASGSNKRSASGGAGAGPNNGGHHALHASMSHNSMDYSTLSQDNSDSNSKMSIEVKEALRLQALHEKVDKIMSLADVNGDGVIR